MSGEDTGETLEKNRNAGKLRLGYFREDQVLEGRLGIQNLN